jgi:hypothetical protein
MLFLDGRLIWPKKEGLIKNGKKLFSKTLKKDVREIHCIEEKRCPVQVTDISRMSLAQPSGMDRFSSRSFYPTFRT